jgi:hypothetical protein
MERHIGKKLKDVPQLQRLFKHYSKARPRSSGLRKPPDWDLSEVLAALREPPFEPMQSISMKHLTWKTVFLLALASGRRRREIAALSFHGGCSLWRDDKIFLKTRVGFMPKTLLLAGSVIRLSFQPCPELLAHILIIGKRDFFVQFVP